MKFLRIKTTKFLFLFFIFVSFCYANLQNDIDIVINKCNQAFDENKNGTFIFTKNNLNLLMAFEETNATSFMIKERIKFQLNDEIFEKFIAPKQITNIFPIQSQIISQIPSEEDIFVKHNFTWELILIDKNDIFVCSIILFLE
jgi:hypothetical protein